MKTPFLLLLVLTSQLAFSQGIKMVSNEQIPIMESEGGCLPIMSPTGDYLILTGNDTQGLRKYDLTTKKQTTLTTEKAVGVQISSDGSTVVYRSKNYKGKLLYTSLKSIQLETGEKEELIKNTRDLEGVNVRQGTVLAVNKGKMVSKRVSGEKLESIPVVPSIKDGQLYITEKGKTRLLSPAGTNVSYLWPSVSPDGKKLLYYVMDQGQAYVSNSDGTNPVSLGILRAPKWMGNDWVVGLVDYDNGEVVTSSEIVGVAADGTQRTVLTDDSVIALYPSASADASKIVYTTNDGKVFLMKIETNK